MSIEELTNTSVAELFKGAVTEDNAPAVKTDVTLKELVEQAAKTWAGTLEILADK